MKTSRALFGILVLSALFVSGGFAQNSVLAQLNPLDPNTPGLRITNASVSSSYFSQYYPGLFGAAPGYPLASGGSASMLQASAAFGWSKVTERSTISVTYSPSYVRGFQAENYHAINQALGITATRRLTSKLMLTTSFQGFVTDFTQLLFMPTLLDGLVGTPATFDEFATGILTGQTTNLGLTQLLSGGGVNGLPQTGLFYGGRELSASANISLQYAWSTRSSMNFSMQGMRMQFLNAASGGSTIEPASLIPATTLASANLGWSYSLTPRTTISASAYSTRVVSRFEDAYSSQVTGSIGRTLSPRWFVQASFGAGYFMPLRQTFATPHRTEPVFSASVGYKFKAQTLLGSYTQTVSDSYGLGANATQGATGGWAWNRPGSSISLAGGIGYARLSGSGFPTTTSWTGHAGVTKRLQSQLSMNASYSYVKYPQRVAFEAPDLAVSGVMVGLTWSPLVRR